MKDNKVLAIIGRDSATTRPVYQWDYGMRLELTGATLPDAYEVHFANNGGKISTTEIGDSTGVDIPDIYLTTGADVVAWLYLHTGEADGETVKYIHIPVIKRAQPTHETPTPVQQSEITEAIAALNAAVEKSETNVSHYPKIEDGYWYIWDAETGTWTQGIAAQGPAGADGKDGVDGKDGAAATITVGTTTTGEAGTDAIVTNSGTTSAAVLDFTIPRGDKGDKGDTGEVSEAELTSKLMDKADILTASASGAIASFADGADNLPVKDLTIAINPIQSGTGDPSPSNPRPIIGCTGATIHRADGENPHVVDDTYSVTWQSEAGTVYGGTLDVTTGVLTVTAQYIHKKLSQRNSQSTSGGFTQYIFNLLGTTSSGSSSNGKLCSIIKEYSYTGLGYGATHFYAAGSSAALILPDDLSDDTEFDLICPLATPITYQLTPTEVRTLLGDNNIWADTGDSAVTYRADTKKYIDTRIAALQALILNS